MPHPEPLICASHSTLHTPWAGSLMSLYPVKGPLIQRMRNNSRRSRTSILVRGMISTMTGSGRKHSRFLWWIYMAECLGSRCLKAELDLLKIQWCLGITKIFMLRLLECFSVDSASLAPLSTVSLLPDPLSPLLLGIYKLYLHQKLPRILYFNGFFPSNREKQMQLYLCGSHWRQVESPDPLVSQRPRYAYPGRAGERWNLPQIPRIAPISGYDNACF